MTYKSLKRYFNAVTQVIVPYKLIGKEKIQAGAGILVGNHYRNWDIVHMACASPDPVHFIAKQELFDKKIIGNLCEIVQAIPVSRDGNDASAVMQAIRYLKKGEKIAMFPEGTRNKRKDVELLPLKGGAALLSIKTESPIYPVICLRKTRFFIRTKIIIGDIVDLSQFYGKKSTVEELQQAEKLVRGAMLITKFRYLADKYQKKLNKINLKSLKKSLLPLPNQYLERLDALLKQE